jgi:rhomboid family GlyGly-CTERM serine protease
MQRKTILASLHCDGPMGLGLLACLALLGMLHVGGPGVTAALRFDRVAIGHGEWWRLLSAHWVHLGARHLLANCAGLCLLWVLYARELRSAHWLLVAGGATAAIDAGLWWLDPQLQWYVGLSGLLHGAWAAGALRQALRPVRLGWVMVALLALKLLLEQRSGVSLVVTGLPVVTVAHLYGALGGLAALAALALARKPL